MRHRNSTALHALTGGLAAVSMLLLGSLPAVAQAREGGTWFDQWLNGGRASNVNQVNATTTTSEERAREAARLDAMLVNTTALFGNNTLGALEIAIERYRQIVARGGWPTLPRQKGAWLRPGARDERSVALRQRLAISGDYRNRVTDSWSFDGELQEALMRFQTRHGLRPNGVVDLNTLDALNVSADARLATLQLNLHRLRAYNERVQAERRYVVMNVPSFDLQAVRGETVELYSKVIAGKDATQTPSVEAKVRALNFFPYWRVPESIAKRQLVPAILKDPDYLSREHIRVMTDWGGEELDPRYINWNSPQAETVKFRQDPGDHNALGLVRLDMPNEHIVYMHDTPLKKLFGRSARPFSAGCVRVEKIMDLATWLVADDPTWNRARVDSILASGIAEDVELAEPVPVFFVYITAWGSDAGEAHFRGDVYGRDGLNNAAFAQYDDEPAVPSVMLSP